MKTAPFSIYRLIVFSLIIFLPACDQKDPQPTQVKGIVDQVVFPYIALGSNVGVVVGVINKGEKSVYYYGEKEIGKREALTSQSIFEIASVTKTFTALALADMHLKGELNLDDPAEKYLPSRVKPPARNGKKITLRQLANHTSGLPGDPTNVDDQAFNKYKGYTEQKFFEFINGYTLPSDPGSEYKYSNVGYGLLGYIIALKNNSSYENAIFSRILQPLGLTNTGVELTNDQKTRLVQGHNGSNKVDPWAPYQQNIFQGTGSLYSNLEDMMTYLEVNMGEKSSPLQDALALTQQMTDISFTALDWQANGIGLAWGLFTVNGQAITCKNGGNGGFTSFIGFDKSTGTGVVIFSNSSLNPDAFPTAMGFKILNEMKHLK